MNIFIRNWIVLFSIICLFCGFLVYKLTGELTYGLFLGFWALPCLYGAWLVQRRESQTNEPLLPVPESRRPSAKIILLTDHQSIRTR